MGSNLTTLELKIEKGHRTVHRSQADMISRYHAYIDIFTSIYYGFSLEIS